MNEELKVSMGVLPKRVDSALLGKFGSPGEDVVLVKMAGIGNLAPFEFRGHEARAFVFRYEPKLLAHVLRVPMSLWMRDDHKLAHDLLNHRRLDWPMVVMVEAGAGNSGR